MLRDNEREGVSVDRGRTRVDGDKNGLRMGMSGLYPYSTLPFVQPLIISLCYHLQHVT
jgi:hypothetical protein